jgi:hypothetical protein
MALLGVRLASRYELLRDVFDDGETQLWEARDTVLDRGVMVKVLHPSLVADAAAVERFTTSARTVARADAQPGRRVLDAGRDEERSLPFVVFESPDALANERDERVPIHVTPRERVATGRSVNQRVMLLALLVPVVAGAFLLRGFLELPSPSIPIGNSSLVLPTAAVAQPSPAPTPGPPTVTARPAQTQPQVTPTPASTVRRRVVNTDGIGVALRDGPNGQRLPGKGYDEGATVTVLEQDGAWTHIRGDDGREGWILTVTLG